MTDDGLSILPTRDELRDLEAQRRAADPDYDLHEAVQAAIWRAECQALVPLAGQPWFGA